MIKLKCILVFFVLISAFCFSQTTFNNIDSLLSKNFQLVNNRDSISYLTLINQEAIFKGKKVKTGIDSLKILKPFTDAFNDLIDNLADMTSGTDFTVVYSGYEFINKSQKLLSNGSLRFHINVIVNNTFSLKMPMVVNSNDGLYSIESPMIVMFLESKE